MDDDKGKLLIISGPSGVGKTSIIKKILELDTKFVESISITTRQPREGEKEGVDYFFRTKEELDKMIKKGEMLECFEMYGNFYGTSKNYVRRMVEEGKNVIFNIDGQGAKIIRERTLAETYSVFIMPPSIEVLRERLEDRGENTPEEIEKRIANAEKEISFKDEYDSIVINDDLDSAVNQIISLCQ